MVYGGLRVLLIWNVYEIGHIAQEFLSKYPNPLPSYNIYNEQTGLLGIANWKQNFSLNTEKRKKYLTTIKMTREEPESQTVVVSTPSSGGNSSKSAQKNLE